ncbi:hypothetical protein [Pseudomonas guariconensis]|uniref:hypothetical protein n=1 Tax=Pseudomonas guariconensis TaxID=1288410 RepID=UPI003466A1FC
MRKLLRGQLGAHADDGGGLALAALLGGGQFLLGQGRAAFLDLNEFVATPGQKGGGDEQR